MLKAEAVGGLPRLGELLVEDSWRHLLSSELDKPYFADLEAFVRSEWAGSQMVFPPKDCVFRCGRAPHPPRCARYHARGRTHNACLARGCHLLCRQRWRAACAPAPPARAVPCRALNSCPVDKVRVVILGQDPYHDLGQAMGLSFSVPHGRAVPSSLRNMYKELREDLGCEGGRGAGGRHAWVDGRLLVVAGRWHAASPRVLCRPVDVLLIARSTGCARQPPAGVAHERCRLPAHAAAVPKHGNLEKWAHQGVLLLNAGECTRLSQPTSPSYTPWQPCSTVAEGVYALPSHVSARS